MHVCNFLLNNPNFNDGNLYIYWFIDNKLYIDKKLFIDNKLFINNVFKISSVILLNQMLESFVNRWH